MLSDCCDYPSPRISLIRKHPTSVSHGTGSSPVPPTIQNKNLGGFPQVASLEFGTVEGQWCRPDNPSVWFTVRKSHPTTRWIEKELRENFARASRAGKQVAKTEARASTVAYRSKERALQIELTNGAAITLPVKLVPSLRRATSQDIRAVEILGRGSGLHFESLDLDLSVPGLHRTYRTGVARGTWARRWAKILCSQSSRSAQERAQGRSSTAPPVVCIYIVNTR